MLGLTNRELTADDKFTAENPSGTGQDSDPQPLKGLGAEAGIEVDI